MKKLDSQRKKVEDAQARIAKKRKALELKRAKGAVRPNGINACEITKPIPVAIGVGIPFKSDGRKYVTVCPERPREVTLDLHSWTGVSPGAMHYYGKLKYHGVDYRDLVSGEVIYGWFSSAPDVSKDGSIELTRTLTENDEGVGKPHSEYIAFGGGNRFAGYEIGDQTNCFDTEAEVVACAHNEFKRIFGDGWKLAIPYEGLK